MGREIHAVSRPALGLASRDTKEQDYLWVRPALHATKLRRLELTAGHAPARGQRGSAYNYNIKATRDQERRRVQQAEKIYERFVAGWNRNGPRVRTSAAKEERHNGCAARLSPQTLLFATQSLARLYSIADDSRENAFRLHPFAKGNGMTWVCPGSPSLVHEL